MTACGGGALPNDGSIAPDTQNDTCETNALAIGCQADAGFLSVNLGEGIGNQEAAPSVAPPTPEPVVNAPAPKPQETPVVKKTEPVLVKKTEPVLKKLAKKKTQPAPAPAPTPTPEPTTSVDTHDSTPETAYSTYSSPSSDGPRGTSSHPGHNDGAIKTEDWVAGHPGIIATRDTTDLENEFLTVGDWTYEERDQNGNVFATTTVTNRLNSGRGNIQDSLRMSLGQAYYDGVEIGGEDKNGIDFFTANHFADTGNDPVRFKSTRYHYAGILSGTDLGAPVDSTGMATWNGSFRTYNTNAVDFQLEINFGDSSISAFVKDAAIETMVIGERVLLGKGTVGNTRESFAFRTRTAVVDNYYLLTGTYDVNGVINGDVNWGQFTGGNSATPKDNRTKNGTLTGLIGLGGAVGVFYSDTNDDGTSGGYVGGFVAAPSNIATGNTDVTFSDWARARPTVTGRNGFIEGGASALPTADYFIACDNHNRLNQLHSTVSGFGRIVYQHQIGAGAQNRAGNCTNPFKGSLNLATATYGASEDSAGEEIDNRISKGGTGGVAFFGNGISDGATTNTLNSGSQSFAGILSNTDLGRPLIATDTVGKWHGRFKSIGGYYFNQGGLQYKSTELDLDFTLTVTFSGGTGTVEAFVPIDGANRYFLLTGTYDNKGVITGEVRASVFTDGDKTAPTTNTDNGVLTGLIGVHGAVGAFVSNADNYNYAGGFVANVTELAVNFADWTGSFGSEPATAPTAGTPQSEFLQATGDTLNVGSLKAVGRVNPITVTALNLSTATFDGAPLGGDAEDGVAFFQGYSADDEAVYAGIFDTTDLGAPITANDARAEWRGQFQVVGAGSIDTDFTLEVTFGGQAAAAGSIEAFVLQAAVGNFYHYLKGTFSDAGVISGTTAAGVYTDGDRTTPLGNTFDGVLTGLIGQDGAVGAFHSHAGGYAGGFVATPTDTATEAVADGVVSYHRTGTYSNAGTHEVVDGVQTMASQIDDTFDIINTESQDTFALVQRGENIVMTVNGTEYTFTLELIPGNGINPDRYDLIPAGAGRLFPTSANDIRKIFDGTDPHIHGTYVTYSTFLYNFDDTEMRDFTFDDFSGYATIGVRTNADVIANKTATAIYSGHGAVETILNNRTHETNADLISGFATFSLDMTVDFYGNTVSGTGKLTRQPDSRGDGTLTFGTAPIVGNGFTGTFTMGDGLRNALGLTSVSTGQYGGHFFGPAANDLAGVMQFNGANPAGTSYGSGGFRADDTLR